MVLEEYELNHVLNVESNEIGAAIQARGISLDYGFEYKGQGFLKKENQVQGYEKALDFATEYLRSIHSNILCFLTS